MMVGGGDGGAELCNKLSRICAQHGDLESSRRFSAASSAPDFPQCHKCLAALIGGRTARVRIHGKFTVVLSCLVCSEPKAARLRKAPKQKRESVKPAAAAAAVPVPAVTPKRPAVVAAAPTTLLGLAEKRAKDEKRSARKSLKLETKSDPPAVVVAAAPKPSSLSAVQRLLFSG